MEEDIRTFEITLIIKADMASGIKTPEYWNWWELLDLRGDEDVYILDCKETVEEDV